MRLSCTLLVALAAAITAAPAVAAERSTEAFLSEALALKAKGPMALFSGRIGALRAEGQAAGDAARAARAAALKKGEKPAYCPPPRATMSDNEMLDRLSRIPKAERDRLPLTQGMTRALAGKWPRA